MKLILVRHGQSEANIANVVDYDPTSSAPLTKKGREQAKATAENLKNEPIDIIYCSQLLRTQQTAAIINEHHHVKTIQDARINEIVVGKNGMPWEEVLRMIAWDHGTWKKVLPHNETFEDELARVQSFLESITQQPQRNVLVVTHAGPFIVLQSLLTGVAVTDISLPTTAEYRTFEVDCHALQEHQP